MIALSIAFRYIVDTLYGWSYNPDIAETTPVWAVPLSLAATHGITFVFFSYG